MYDRLRGRKCISLVRTEKISWNTASFPLTTYPLLKLITSIQACRKHFLWKDWGPSKTKVRLTVRRRILLEPSYLARMCMRWKKKEGWKLYIPLSSYNLFHAPIHNWDFGLISKACHKWGHLRDCLQLWDRDSTTPPEQ